MVFVNDRQRKAVMAMFNKLDNDNNRLNIMHHKSYLVATTDNSKEMERKHNEEMRKLEVEVKKIEYEAKGTIMFSEKRGSVPLLDTTFVIRGGSPKERQVIKKLLDSIGSETPLTYINTVRIEPDLKEAFSINQETRTLSIRAGDLHIKSGDFPIDLAMAILARALILKDPSITEDAALDRAREAITLYMADIQYKDKLKRERENIEVYQVGVEKQPQYEVEYPQGPATSPVDVRLFQEPVPQEQRAVEQSPVLREAPEPIFT